MNRQDYYRQQYQSLKPDWQDSLSIYQELVKRHLKPDSSVLDVGCGHSDLLKTIYEEIPETWGIDPDQKALDQNKTVKNKVLGKVEKLPFQPESFDLVTTAWVLEHLNDPLQAVREIYRVLKPGGFFIFLTPNLWNYNVWLAKLIPNRLHQFLTQVLYQRGEGDAYPVKYRLNSPGKIDQLLTNAGFAKSSLVLNGDPSYISFNQVLFRLACLIETLTDHPALNFTRVHLIGAYQKEK